MSFFRNNECPHALLVSHDSVTRQASNIDSTSRRLAFVSPARQAPQRYAATVCSKDRHARMSMMVHYRVALSPSSITNGEGRLLDLSAEGCRIETKDALPVNTYLSLRLMISPQELPVLVDLAAVRWSRGTNCGVHFLAVQPLQAQRLRTFLASARSIQPPPLPPHDD